MNCVCCGEPVKSMTGTKIRNGKICNNCTSKLPSLMLKGMPYLQEHTLKNAIAHIGENVERFSATASYGDLHIDEMHGLFTIATKLNADNKPKSGNNVFSIYDLTEVGLLCTSPHTNNNNVFVDVEFQCTLNNPHIIISKIIKRNVKCTYHRIDSQHVSWDEPSELAMFRTMFEKMLTGAFDKISNILCGKTVYAFELEKARAVFMLSKNFTVDDLKKARRLMMKVYHPDTTTEDVSREAQLINYYYNFLMADIERGGDKK